MFSFNFSCVAGMSNKYRHLLWLFGENDVVFVPVLGEGEGDVGESVFGEELTVLGRRRDAHVRHHVDDVPQRRRDAAVPGLALHLLDSEDGATYRHTEDEI